MIYRSRRHAARIRRRWAKRAFGWLALIVLAWGAVERLNLLNWLTG